MGAGALHGSKTRPTQVCHEEDNGDQFPKARPSSVKASLRRTASTLAVETPGLASVRGGEPNARLRHQKRLAMAFGRHKTVSTETKKGSLQSHVRSIARGFKRRFSRGSKTTASVSSTAVKGVSSSKRSNPNGSAWSLNNGNTASRSGAGSMTHSKARGGKSSVFAAKMLEANVTHHHEPYRRRATVLLAAIEHFNVEMAVVYVSTGDAKRPEVLCSARGGGGSMIFLRMPNPGSVQQEVERLQWMVSGGPGPAGVDKVHHGQECKQVLEAWNCGEALSMGPDVDASIITITTTTHSISKSNLSTAHTLTFTSDSQNDWHDIYAAAEVRQYTLLLARRRRAFSKSDKRRIRRWAPTLIDDITESDSIAGDLDFTGSFCRKASASEQTLLDDGCASLVKTGTAQGCCIAFHMDGLTRVVCRSSTIERMTESNELCRRMETAVAKVDVGEWMDGKRIDEARQFMLFSLETPRVETDSLRRGLYFAIIVLPPDATPPKDFRTRAVDQAVAAMQDAVSRRASRVSFMKFNLLVDLDRIRNQRDIDHLALWDALCTFIARRMKFKTCCLYLTDDDRGLEEEPSLISSRRMRRRSITEDIGEVVRVEDQRTSSQSARKASKTRMSLLAGVKTPKRKSGISRASSTRRLTPPAHRRVSGSSSQTARSRSFRGMPTQRDQDTKRVSFDSPMLPRSKAFLWSDARGETARPSTPEIQRARLQLRLAASATNEAEPKAGAISTVLSDHLRQQRFDDPFGQPKSCLIVPPWNEDMVIVSLVLDGDVIGALAVAPEESHGLTDTHAELLLALSSQVCSAVVQVLARAALTIRTHQLKIISQIDLLRNQPLPDMLKDITQVIAAELHVDASFLAVRENDAFVLKAVFVRDPAQQIQIMAMIPRAVAQIEKQRRGTSLLQKRSAKLHTTFHTSGTTRMFALSSQLQVSAGQSLGAVGIVKLEQPDTTQKGAAFSRQQEALMRSLWQPLSTVLYDAVKSEHLRAVFSRSVDPTVMEQMLNAQTILETDKKEISVLFCDLRNSTELAENIDPELFVEFCNDYFAVHTEVVMANHGMIDKFVGDEVMAVFGAPIENKKHSFLALKAADDMMRAHERLLDKWVQHGIQAQIGIGIATGVAIVGEMGCDLRTDYTCMGRTVNLASRLCDLAKPCGIRICSETLTAASLYGSFDTIEHTGVRVKGIERDISMHELLRQASKGSYVVTQALMNHTTTPSSIDYTTRSSAHSRSTSTMDTSSSAS